MRIPIGRKRSRYQKARAALREMLPKGNGHKLIRSRADKRAHELGPRADDRRLPLLLRGVDGNGTEGDEQADRDPSHNHSSEPGLGANQHPA